MRHFMICTHKIFGSSNQERDTRGMQNIWGRGEVNAVSWWEDSCIDGGMILKMDFHQIGWGVLTN